MIGNRLKQLREERDLTQGEMAKKIGTTAQYYGVLERNEKIPSVNSILKMAKVLSVSTDYLLGNSENQSNEGKYLKQTPKGFICKAKQCEWRDSDGFCHSGAGCLKEWTENREKQNLCNNNP